MSYIDKDVLKSFYQENSFMVKQETITSIDSLVLQIDGIIQSKTGLTTPSTIATANKYLQNIACRIFVFLRWGKKA